MVESNWKRKTGPYVKKHDSAWNLESLLCPGESWTRKSHLPRWAN